MDLMSCIRGDFVEKETRAVASNRPLVVDIIHLIIKLEKAIACGMLLLLNALLYTLTVLPFVKTVNFFFSHNTARLVLISLVSVLLNYFYPASRLYHDLKDQDIVKITAAYNMVSISDRMLANWGKKVIEISFTKSKFSVKVFNQLVCGLYLFVHSFHQCIALTLFEVALSSSPGTLSLVLITTAFVELKISVFKGSNKKKLFKILCFDFIDRFQMLLYLSIILLKTAVSFHRSIEMFLNGAFWVILTSMVIDWIKHYYLISINGLFQNLYDDYIEINMRTNLMMSLKKNTYISFDVNCDNTLDYACSVAMSYKFTILPHVCLIVREFWDILVSFSFMNLCVLIAILYVLKCLCLALFLRIK